MQNPRCLAQSRRGGLETAVLKIRKDRLNFPPPPRSLASTEAIFRALRASRPLSKRFFAKNKAVRPRWRDIINGAFDVALGALGDRALTYVTKARSTRPGARNPTVADIFVSYTSSDREWAQWIATDLHTLGHVPHVHEWEIGPGDDIVAWMEQRHAAADHVLCVVSPEYLNAAYSMLEHNAALWRSVRERSSFLLYVVVKPCALPALTAHKRRCDVYNLPEAAARQRFRDYMMAPAPPDVVAFPGRVTAESNISIRVPMHFMGRDDALAETEAALARHQGRVAVTALHGMRGVGKTILAVAYAEAHRHDYRATWWIRAETEDAMRADLAALGYRLGWALADDSEKDALAKVADRLRQEGEGILLIFDNALDKDTIAPFLPLGGTAHVLITSNAHAWRGVAEPLEIKVWPTDVGGDYLIARVGRPDERDAAEALSDALGGLPLAHEMAAAYCEDLGLSFAEYRRRLDASPVEVLDDKGAAPAPYHDRMTVARTFALAIEQAAKLHPAAEPLIVAAAQLPPEPIPLFLFAEGREKLADGLDALLQGRGLERAVAALRRLALVETETIPDERDPGVKTEAIRLHRLIRTTAQWHRAGVAAAAVRKGLIAALASVYPVEIYDKPELWPRGRWLDAIVLGLLGGADESPAGSEADRATLANGLAQYRFGALGAYELARPLFERAVTLRERAFGADHPHTADALNDLAVALQYCGDLGSARPLYERALAINEKVLGADHPHTADALNNLAMTLEYCGDLGSARPLYERALAINEKALGAEHPHTANILNSLGCLLRKQSDLQAARQMHERSLAIQEKILGAEHPDTATALNTLAIVLLAQKLANEARPLFERGLSIREKKLGSEHPETAFSLNDLAACLQSQGDLAAARPLYQRAVAIWQKAHGPNHPDTLLGLGNLAGLLDAQGDMVGAEALHRQVVEGRIRIHGPSHPAVLSEQNNLAHNLRKRGRPDLAESYARACAENTPKAVGAAHPLTAHRRNNLALTLLMLRRDDEANALLAQSWRTTEKRYAIVTPAVPFLALLSALGSRQDLADPLGRLKTLLLGPPLPRAGDVAHPWDVGYLLDFLCEALPADQREFLSALLAAINNPDEAVSLDRFPLWCDTPPVPSDAPWPEQRTRRLEF